VGRLTLLCPFQPFLVFAVMVPFQPKANRNGKLETLFNKAFSILKNLWQQIFHNCTEL